MKTLHVYLLAILILGLYACNNNIPEKSEEELSQEIEQALEKYVDAVKTLNVDSVVNCWTEDGRYISSQRDVEGKESLTEWLTPLYKDLNVFELKATTTKLDITNNLAVHLSEYSQIISIGDGPKSSVSGEQLFIWIKENGKWKISMGYGIPSQKDTIH